MKKLVIILACAALSVPAQAMQIERKRSKPISLYVKIDARYRLSCGYCRTRFISKCKYSIRTKYQEHLRLAHGVCSNSRCPLFQKGEPHESPENASNCWQAKKHKGYDEFPQLIDAEGDSDEFDESDIDSDVSDNEHTAMALDDFSSIDQATALLAYLAQLN